MASNAQWTTLMPIKRMDRAIAFYTKTLGGRLLSRGDGEMKDAWASVKVAGHELWLIQPEKREKRSLSYSNLVVSNIKRYVAGLATRGVKFEKGVATGPNSRVEGPITWEPWGAAAFFKDSEGNLLMVWQNTM